MQTQLGTRGLSPRRYPSDVTTSLPVTSSTIFASQTHPIQTRNAQELHCLTDTHLSRTRTRPLSFAFTYNAHSHTRVCHLTRLTPCHPYALHFHPTHAQPLLPIPPPPPFHPYCHTHTHELTLIHLQLAAVLPDAVRESGDRVLSNGERVDKLLTVNKDRVMMEVGEKLGLHCNITFITSLRRPANHSNLEKHTSAPPPSPPSHTHLHSIICPAQLSTLH
jgi:hypothetical protein